MVRYADFSLPIGYEVIKKDIAYCDIKTRQTRRKSSVTKNQLFQNLIDQAITNKVMFDYVLADNWFGSKANIRLSAPVFMNKFPSTFHPSNRE
jgi:hypothetical protein